MHIISPHNPLTEVLEESSLLSASIGRHQAKYEPVGIGSVFLPDYRQEDLGLVRAGADVLGPLIQLALSFTGGEYVKLHTPLLQKVKGRTELEATILAIYQNKSLGRGPSAMEFFNGLRNDRQISEDSLPELSDLASIIGSMIRDTARSLDDNIEMAEDFRLTYPHLAYVINLTLDKHGEKRPFPLESCQILYTPCSIDIIAPRPLFELLVPANQRGNVAAVNIQGYPVTVYDEPRWKMNPSVRFHERMRAILEGSIACGMDKHGGTRAVSEFAGAVYGGIVRTTPTFAARASHLLWKSIVADLHQELLASAAQILVENEPRQKVDEARSRALVDELFSNFDPAYWKKSELDPASEVTFEKLCLEVDTAITSTAGRQLLRSLKILKIFSNFIDADVREHLHENALQATRVYVQSANALVAAVWEASRRSREEGCRALAAAILLNPWQLSLLPEVMAEDGERTAGA